MKTGVELIAEERQKDVYSRKVGRYVWVYMAQCYCTPESERKYPYKKDGKPWPKGWPIGYAPFEFASEDRIKELQKAGACIAAEIDMLQKGDDENL